MLFAAGACAQRWEAGTDGLLPIPPLTAHVTDLTQTLSSGEKQALDAKLADPIAAQKWYIEHFGATPGKRNAFDTANVPGTEITLGKVDTAQAPTKGRSVDHMGFEVRNIDDFVNRFVI